MSVAIIGAGIGGLSLGLCLHKLNIPFKIYEAVNEIKPIGVGINIQPHAVRELFTLGLQKELDNIGIRSQEVAYFSKQGDLIWSEPRGVLAGYNWPQYSINRGDLQMLLYETIKDRVGSDVIKTNFTLNDWKEEKTGLEMHFINRKDGTHIASEQSIIMIACDGINSIVRARMNPTESSANWSGIMMWRGTTKVPKYLSGKTMVMVGQKIQKFVAYPIHEFADGDILLNWICDLKAPKGYNWTRQDWNAKGKLRELWSSFKDWNFPWLDVASIIRNTKDIYKYPMVDRDPLDKWTGNRVSLLGDAAHPMYPIGSNGASQAILDSAFLARCIERHGINEDALIDYESIRRPVTNEIIKKNRLNGPDEILDIVAQKAPNGFSNINDIMSYKELGMIAEKYKTIAGFDAHTLNLSKAIMG